MCFLCEKQDLCRLAMETLEKLMVEITRAEKRGRSSGEAQMNEIVLPTLSDFQTKLKEIMK